MRLMFLTLALCLSAQTLYAAPKVVVSITPLHSLVSAITEGVTEPTLLLSQGESPHSASLRPSQAQSLHEADLLIWVGPELESFLSRPIANLTRQNAEVRLSTQKSLTLLAQREGGMWSKDEHDDHAQHDSQHQINPHLWLSTKNAVKISEIIAQRLIELDPLNKGVYLKNQKSLRGRIEKLDHDLTARLNPVSKLPYLVFHDAYAYFEENFGLNAVGSVRISADRAPGARRLHLLQKKITQSQAICLFTEPQFNPALAKRISVTTQIRLGSLDPIGDVTGKPEERWFNLMTSLADNLKSCLERR